MIIELTDRQIAEELQNFLLRNKNNHRLWSGTETGKIIKSFLLSTNNWKNDSRGKNKVENSLDEIKEINPNDLAEDCPF